MRISAHEPSHGLYTERDSGRGCRCAFCCCCRSAFAAVVVRTLTGALADPNRRPRFWVARGPRGSYRSAYHRHRKLAAEIARRDARLAHLRNRG